MPVIAVVGGQWGDEGKGKIIDLLARRAQVVVRAQGGNNAGHTIVNEQVGKFALHLVPAGIFNPATLCVIGAGVALNPVFLLEELEALHALRVSTDNLVISERAHIVMPYHVELDRLQEADRGAGKLGTTGRGIGPTYVDKVSRLGIRAGDLNDEQRATERIRAAVQAKNRLIERMYDAPPLDIDSVVTQYLDAGRRLARFVGDPSEALDAALRRDDAILLEGAQATLLDLDHGTYPFVTTSSPTVAGLLQGAGIGPRFLAHGLGVFKAYSTRVGGGPFPTELLDDTGDRLRDVGQEYGTTTGRPRRCGWFDAVAARYSCLVNGFDTLAITRLDILSGFSPLRICVAYEFRGQRMQRFPASADDLAECRPIYEELETWDEPIGSARRRADLPAAARRYLERIETLLDVPVALIGVGQEREATIVERDLLV
jgi:adenylosuccinate synthase